VNIDEIEPIFTTDLGRLYEENCLDVLPTLDTDSIDTIFADPPFNLNKDYGSHMTDLISDEKYIAWCETWLTECKRILKPGGSIFIYNLPKWNIPIGNILSGLSLNFRHWIAIEKANGGTTARSKHLSPAHYSLLYYTLGIPTKFHKIRTPIKTCRHCAGDIKDYGGHRKKLNPNGISLKDVWSDIALVTHKKFKSKLRTANALSTKILERVVHISTDEGDLVLDPFGGSGTTYDVCERTGRRWIGIEMGNTAPIIDRIKNMNIEPHRNDDFVEMY
jgi:site-specific DNA-methyltransferase (adenine-specific)